MGVRGVFGRTEAWVPLNNDYKLNGRLAGLEERW